MLPCGERAVCKRPQGKCLEGGGDRFPQQTQGKLQSILGRLTCGDGPALDFVCPSGKISEGLNTAFQVDKKGMKEGLAGVHGLQGLQEQDGSLCRQFSFLSWLLGRGVQEKAQPLGTALHLTCHFRKPASALKWTCPLLARTDQALCLALEAGDW